jgi:hypothetical protein
MRYHGVRKISSTSRRTLVLIDMDPFKLLPLELSIHVLGLVEENPALRPEHLHAPLLVSRRWNSVGMRPELWRDLSLSGTRCIGGVERLLARAQGALRSLRWNTTTPGFYTSSVWGGALKRAFAKTGGLVEVYLDLENSDDEYYDDYEPDASEDQYKEEDEFETEEAQGRDDENKAGSEAEEPNVVPLERETNDDNEAGSEADEPEVFPLELDTDGGKEAGSEAEEPEVVSLEWDENGEDHREIDSPVRSDESNRRDESEVISSVQDDDSSHDDDMETAPIVYDEDAYLRYLNLDHFVDEVLPICTHEKMLRIVETLGSPTLEQFSMSAPADRRTTELVHGILMRSLNLWSFSYTLPTVANPKRWRSLFLPFIQSLSASNGSQPLQNLQSAKIDFWCPSFWEYLSRLGVKLRTVEITVAGLDGGCDLVGGALSVIAGPQVENFTFRDWDGPVDAIPHWVQEAVFAHPRRSVSISGLYNVHGIRANSMLQMQSLSFHVVSQDALNLVFSLPFSGLTTLYLDCATVDDASLAWAIRAVSWSLESLSISRWRNPADVYSSNLRTPTYRHACVETVAAIGSAKFLRWLGLSSINGISYTMLEPLLIGVPPSQPPHCPRIWNAFIDALDGECTDFVARLRVSIKQRFPFTGVVNRERVCKPAVFREKSIDLIDLIHL